MTGETRAPAGVLDGGLLTVPGLDALREIHAGRAPQPPIHDWSGRKLVGLQRGEASIAMPGSGWFCGPKGRLHSGIFAPSTRVLEHAAEHDVEPEAGG